MNITIHFKFVTNIINFLNLCLVTKNNLGIVSKLKERANMS